MMLYRKQEIFLPVNNVVNIRTTNNALQVLTLHQLC